MHGSSDFPRWHEQRLAAWGGIRGVGDGAQGQPASRGGELEAFAQGLRRPLLP